MNIFIGNLSGEATLVELQSFLGNLQIHSDVQHCKGNDPHEMDYHYFIIHADDEKQGNALIERFHGQVFHGRDVVAREYLQRCVPSQRETAERRINKTFLEAIA